MPARSAYHDLHRLRRTVLLPNGGGLTDGQLLEEFVLRRDEAAFEALVRRHGPMVLGVCRRVIGHEPDAEDAFQAAFLVLVRRAASIVPREKVATWLYGVAYRTALEARKVMIRRRNKEKPMKDVLDFNPTSKADRQELTQLLDQELSRLPDKYRLPVVLCELVGRSRKEVAQQLRLPEGTLSSRLAMARKMLARRLARRGVTLPASALAVELSGQGATAAVPLSLVDVTVNTAATLAKGAAPAAGSVSAKVISLTEVVSKAMFLTKLKLSAVLIFAVLTAGLGAGLLARQGLPYQPVLQIRDASPNAALENVVVASEKDVGEGNKKRSQERAPKKWKVRLDLDTGHRLEVWSVAFWPDGKLLATASLDKTVKLWDPASGKEIAILKMSLPVRSVAISQDGNQLAVGQGEIGENKAGELAIGDAKTRRIAGQIWKRNSPVYSVDYSPDGRFLAATFRAQAGQDQDKTITLWGHGGGKENWLQHEGLVYAVKFSPDGKILASAGSDKTVRLWDPATGKEIRRINAHSAEVRAVAFSPDGKRLVTAGQDKKVNLWDVATGKQIAALDENQGGVLSVALSPDGHILASADGQRDQSVKLWDLTRMKQIDVQPVDQHHIKFVAFSPDGNTLVTVGDGTHVKLWSREAPNRDAK
jgi:RNA polymerase sigma factor (sigma-70 family)